MSVSASRPTHRRKPSGPPSAGVHAWSGRQHRLGTGTTAPEHLIGVRVDQ